MDAVSGLHADKFFEEQFEAAESREAGHLDFFLPGRVKKDSGRNVPPKPRGLLESLLTPAAKRAKLS